LIALQRLQLHSFFHVLLMRHLAWPYFPWGLIACAHKMIVESKVKLHRLMIRFVASGELTSITESITSSWCADFLVHLAVQVQATSHHKITLVSHQSWSIGLR